MKNIGCIANVARWTGRVWGLGIILVLTLILIFWYLDSAGGVGPPGYVYLVGIVIIAGMVISWQKEGLGALISTVGLVGFYIALWTFDRSVFQYWGWVFFAILPPIVCFLTSTLLRRKITS